MFDLYEPVYETFKFVLIVHALSFSLNMHTQLSNGIEA